MVIVHKTRSYWCCLVVLSNMLAERVMYVFGTALTKGDGAGEVTTSLSLSPDLRDT